MRKKRLAILSLLLPAFILFASAGNMFAPLGEAKQTADPFAAMYNANEPLLEKMDVTLRETASDKPQVNFLARSIMPEKSYEEQMETLKELVLQGRADEFESADGVSAELADKAAAIREEIYQDRYLVKYSSGVNANSRASVFSGISSVMLSEGIELITFDEKTNPAALAEELRDAGADSYIEYIQPDIMLYPASGGLSLELLEDGDDKSGEGEKELPPEEDDEEPGDNTEPSPNEPEEGISDPEEEPLEELTEELTEETSSEVIVALIDTYVDISHPMIEDSLWEHPDTGLNGWNFYENSDVLYDPADAYYTLASHGTHIAGIIARNSNVKIMVLPVFGRDGARTSDIIAAIEYAAENGATVINCSFGSGYYNPALEGALAESGALVVAAAGNGRSSLESNPVYPASFALDNVISVGSVNDDGAMSYFSNYDVDITAPGRDIVSALPENESGPMTGTSMSAAYVSGGAAAVLAANPGMTAAELKDRLLGTADRLSGLEEYVSGGRMFNISDAVIGETNKLLIHSNPTNDINTLGYSATPAETWELFSGSGTVIQVAAGHEHSLALKDDGTVWAWGYNGYGQLGDGTTVSKSSPVQVLGLSDVVHIAAGADHSLAVKSDGTLWAWGCGSGGRLGDGQIFWNVSSPGQVIGLTNVTKAEGGYNYSLAIKGSHGVWGFGYADYGKLGALAEEIEQAWPIPLFDFGYVDSVAAGDCHVLGLESMYGDILVMGSNYDGQLGVNNSVLQLDMPDVMTDENGIMIEHGVAVAAGAAHSLVLLDDGSVIGCGYDAYGQCRAGNYTDYTAVGAYDCGSFGIREGGTVWQWGYVYDPNMIDPDSGMSWHTFSSPMQVTDITGVTSASMGNGFMLALKNDGSVWSWGLNDCGQLGDGTMEDRGQPVMIFEGVPEPGGSETTFEVEAGQEYVLAVNASNFENPGDYIYTVSYDVDKLELLDLASQTGAGSVSVGAVTGTGLTILSHTNTGNVTFNFDKNVPAGYAWSGTMTLLRFRALASATTTVTISNGAVTDRPMRTVTGLVWPMVTNDRGAGEDFLNGFEIVVELRSNFWTPAPDRLKTTVVYDSPNTGRFTIEDVPCGDYVLYIKRAGYLARPMKVTVSQESSAIMELAATGADENGVFKLWWGDVIGNHTIDGRDVLAIQDHMGSSYGDMSYTAAADLNADGNIDVSDLGMINENMNLSVTDYPGAENVDFDNP